MFEHLSFFDTDHNLNTRRRGVKVLSCGAGMQSTALALMSVANKLIQDGKTDQLVYEERVPVYDLIVFCDLGLEPPWVYSQVEFIKNACESAGIPFCIIDSHLYDDYINNFGTKRVTSIPSMMHIEVAIISYAKE